MTDSTQGNLEALMNISYLLSLTLRIQFLVLIKSDNNYNCCGINNIQLQRHVNELEKEIY